MKKNIVILLSAFFVASCKKDIGIPKEGTITLPFENENLKVELVTSSMPVLVRDMHFFDATKGVIVTYDGNVFATSDNGKTWVSKFDNPDNGQPLLEVEFVSSSTGYAIGGGDVATGAGNTPPGGLLLRTNDGGNTWTKIYTNPRALFSIASNSKGELFTILNGISKSVDEGVTWTTVDSSFNRSGTILFNGTHGLYTGWFGKIFRTSDDGKTWQLLSRPDSGSVADIAFLGNSLYYINNSQTVFRSSDFGDTWTKTFHSQNSSGIVTPLTDRSCLVFGAGPYPEGCFGIPCGAIRQTTNAGLDWKEIQLNEMRQIIAASFYSSTEGFATDGAGHLIMITVKSKNCVGNCN